MDKWREKENEEDIKRPSSIHFEFAEDDSALYYINKAIQIDSLVGYFSARSRIYGALEDYRNCIKDATYILSLDANYVSALFNRSRAYYELGIKDSACLDYQHLYLIEPNANLDEWVTCE